MRRKSTELTRIPRLNWMTIIPQFKEDTSTIPQLKEDTTLTDIPVKGEDKLMEIPFDKLTLFLYGVIYNKNF